MEKVVTAMVCLMGALLGLPAWGAGSEPAAVVDAYLGALVTDEPSAAFDALMTHSRIDELKPREIELVKGQIQQGITLYGKPSGYEKISEDSYGSSILRLVYITKHADVPLVWNFFFYRASEEWLILTFDFNDQLQGLQ